MEKLLILCMSGEGDNLLNKIYWGLLYRLNLKVIFDKCFVNILDIFVKLIYGMLIKIYVFWI